MPVRRITAMLLAALAIFVATVPALTETAESVFASKGKELTAGMTSRVDRLVAIHGFTRDQIKQVKTNYS